MLAAHRLAPDGAGTLVRTPEHRAELERVVLSAFTTEPRRASARATTRPARRPAPRPPGCWPGWAREVTVDLARYAELAEAGR